ncbi:MAG TPA: hypothetical protein VNE62_06935 [Actinomycetota bacterium]|nr:hypothetical protein [Actinomycetota bacterium]
MDSEDFESLAAQLDPGPQVAHNPDGTWTAWWPDLRTPPAEAPTREAAIAALPIRHVRYKPVVSRESPDVWVAAYPEFGVEARGPSEGEALRALVSEHLSRRALDPEYRELMDTLMSYPPDRFTVEYLSEAEYGEWQRRLTADPAVQMEVEDGPDPGP